MNKANIVQLSSMLLRMGFDPSITLRLLRQICFNPASFSLIERIERQQDRITCTLNFERRVAAYVCESYEACLLRPFAIADKTINGISLQSLDKRMGEIDWVVGKLEGVFRLDDESTWARELAISEIINELNRLSALEEGKYFADALKVKYWSFASLDQIVGNLNSIQSKFECSQRFYIFEGEGISVEEAYRFLLNRWMEKRMLAERRLESRNAGEASEPEQNGSGGGLLKKRNAIKKQKLKK